MATLRAGGAQSRAEGILTGKLRFLDSAQSRKLRLEAWRPLLEAAETGGPLLPILVHIPAPGIEDHIAALPARARRHLAGAYHHIPAAVAALHGLHRSAAERRTSRRH